jgi:rubrerythrin
MGNAPVTGEANRRQLIARALAAVVPGSDASRLRAAVRAEQVLASTYSQVLTAGVLPAPAAAQARLFLSHERAHLAALQKQLLRLGGRALAPVAPIAGGIPGREREAVRLLLALERVTLGVYYSVLGELRDPGAAQLAAEIMATDAQHATVLRQTLAPGDVTRAVPNAFVFGTR